MESNENRLNVNFAYCKDTEEIVFENGNKVQLKDIVSNYLFPKEATAKENLVVGDCISREYILSKAHCCCDELADDEPCCVDVDDIKNAPSVKPKTDILDKIRAEIEQKIRESEKKFKEDGTIAHDIMSFAYLRGITKAKEIIDKHIADMRGETNG